MARDANLNRIQAYYPILFLTLTPNRYPSGYNGSIAASFVLVTIGVLPVRKVPLRGSSVGIVTKHRPVSSAALSSVMCF